MKALSQHVELWIVVRRGIRDRQRNGLLQLCHLRIVIEGEDSGQDLRLTDRFPFTRVDRDHDRHEPVSRQSATVSQNAFADIPDAQALDQANSNLDPLRHGGAGRRHLEDVAVVKDRNVIRWHTNGKRQISVSPLMTGFTVNRSEELGTDQTQHQPQLIGRPVSRYVDIGRLQHNVGPCADETVHRVVPGKLISGDGPRRKDDGVALANADLLVIAMCHPPEC